jgi:CRP-like cAMP-binding protein
VKSSKTSAARAKKNKMAHNMTGESATFLASPAPGRKHLSCQSQQIILRQGAPADAVFYIASGRVQVTVVSAQGKEGVVALLSKGDFVGEGCLAGQPLYLASAKTIEESSIVRIEKGAMIELLHEQPSFAEFFTAFLLSRNIQIEADLVDQLFNSSEKRLARVLLLLAQFGKDGKLEPVIPKISQEVLAARVGTTRSRINFFMNKFRDLGLIEYNGELKVHSALLNVIIHD